MSDEEKAFLLAIRERPDDDAPRLIFADWLDENAHHPECSACHGSGGEPVLTISNGLLLAKEVACEWCHGQGVCSCGRAERAEFIRLQIERANKPLLWHNSLRLSREMALQGRFGHLWSEGLPQGLPRYFSRGFVDEICIDHDAFLRQAEQIFSLHPITRVTLHTKRPSERDKAVWCWFNADYEWSGPNNDELHPIIFYLLPDSDAGVYDVAGFPTEQAAIDAASFACVILGRKRAELPPLKITAVNSTLSPTSLPT